MQTKPGCSDVLRQVLAVERDNKLRWQVGKAECLACILPPVEKSFEGQRPAVVVGFESVDRGLG